MALLSLQQSAGNRAVSCLVQRFAVTDNPINWDEATKAEASEKGATGVIFVSDRTDATIVGKFLMSDEAAAALFAGSVFERLKVPTPTARALNPAETGKLRTKLNELAAHSADPRRFRRVLGRNDARVALVEDATTLLHRLTHSQTTSGAEKAELLLKLLNRSEIGVFIAADAFLGNRDRMENQNLGNIMVGTRDNAMHAIDNDTLAIALTYCDQLVAPNDAKEWSNLILRGAAVGSGMPGLRSLSTDPAEVKKLLQRAFRHVVSHLSGHGFDEVGPVAFDDVSAAWLEGVTATREKLTQLHLKDSRATLTSEFVSKAPGGQTARYAWPALRVRLKYPALQMPRTHQARRTSSNRRSPRALPAAASWKRRKMTPTADRGRGSGGSAMFRGFAAHHS